MKHIFVDERTERINGLVSFFCLMLTQIALVVVIVYKRYFLVFFNFENEPRGMRN